MTKSVLEKIKNFFKEEEDEDEDYESEESGDEDEDTMFDNYRISIPNKKNFCGGAFPDWLEVNLTNQCNAKCAWCIEKKGYHPEKKADWVVIAEMALKHGAKNIILLGGEPTLYNDLKLLVKILAAASRNVWITTNGSLLTADFVRENLDEVSGVNISIHHYEMSKNREITGLNIEEDILISAINELHKGNALVRLNCNCIAGMIDSCDEILKYVDFAKRIGVDKIRFAELKQDDDGFVDLAKILDYKYGLNDNPFVYGCNSDTIINGMPVNFRQMCGLQTTRRVKPENPKQVLKKVLYYDGMIYDGWQLKSTESDEMEKKTLLKEILRDVADGKKTVEMASMEIEWLEDSVIKRLEKLEKRISNVSSSDGVGCQY